MLRPWLAGILHHRALRIVATATGIAVAVALVALVGVFSTLSARTMTERALAQVPVDWQVETPAGDTRVAAAIDNLAGLTARKTVGYAAVAGLQTVSGGTTQTTGAAMVLGLPPDYAATFSTQIRPLLGQTAGILLAQQTAANLHAGIGDRVTILREGQPPIDVTIDGVVDLPNAVALFQTIGAPAGAGPTPPPDNVLLLPFDQWSSAFPANAPGVSIQEHVTFDTSGFATDPATAFVEAGQRARNFEVATAGQARIGDNLAARLDAVRTDSIYAQVLFLFLGLPAALLGVLLTVAVVSSDADRRRHDEALLRMRGYDRRAILTVIASEEAMGAAFAALAGGLAALVIALIFYGNVALSAGSLRWIAGAAAAGFAVSLACGLLPAFNRLRTETVASGRRVLGRDATPLWQRLGLDFWLLGVAGVIYWRSAATNYQVVLAPEGVTATAVDYTAFLAPLLFWIGAVLLVLRLCALGLRHGRGALAGGFARARIGGALAPLVAASLSRQSRRIAAGAALVTLAISFAFATAIFNRTYEGQARVDALLTNGADVAITGTTAGPVDGLAADMAALPDVMSAEPMQHRFAYVGNDLQDIYGVDPARIGAATTLSNSFFANRDAAATLASLAATPDGLLVSQETVNDYQLALGDSLNLRLTDATGQWKTIPFTFVGVVLEFPTAPKDSFLVANRSYLASATGQAGSEVLLVRSQGDPATLAASLRTSLGSTSPYRVSEVGEAAHVISSSLTSVDLGRLSSIELGFAVLLLLGASGLVLWLGFRERADSMQTLSEIGASAGEVRGFLLGETLLVLVPGAAFGSLLGVAIAFVMVRMLSGIFDPPPDALAYPVAQLAAFAAVALAGTTLAVVAGRPRAGRGGA